MAASASATDSGRMAGPRAARGATPAARAGRGVRIALFYLCLGLIAAVFVAPYVIAFFAAFKPESAVYGTAPWSPPHSVYTQNFSTVLFTDGFARFLENTAAVTAVLTIGQVGFGVLAAYAFARLEFPGRDLLFSVYLATLMVPNVVTLVPLYTIMRQAHLVNTYWALFLPYVLGSPYTIFLMRQYFMTIPKEVMEAARLDGCSESRILWRIVVPISRPIIITATLLAVVFGWNNFLWPLIVTNSNSLQVLSVATANFNSNFGVQWNLILAASLVALIPMVILFAIFQKYIVRSISLTGINR